MKTVAVGREAVLNYLEQDALKRTGGKPGVYRAFAGDTSGKVVIVIAGHFFTGTFTLTASEDALDTKNIHVENGIVTAIDKE